MSTARKRLLAVLRELLTPVMQRTIGYAQVTHDLD